MKNLQEIENHFTDFIRSQKFYEEILNKKRRKYNGLFYTNSVKVIDNIIDIIGSENIINKKILEPSCGHGIFLLRIIKKIYENFPKKEIIDHVIENNLIFVDIDSRMVAETEENINKLYNYLFGINYSGKFNGHVYDFTLKLQSNDLFSSNKPQENPLLKYFGKIDYVIGNPPYVTLYGRRDKKKNEDQRVYYLNNFEQFPSTLKNGKINFVMLFIEHSLDFLKKGGRLSFIIDLSFFETAYMYTRKYLIENTRIHSINYNMTNFNVGSGQLIIKLIKDKENKEQIVELINSENGKTTFINQSHWHNKHDDFRFRIKHCDKTENIFNRIYSKNDKTMKQLFPKKNLRTCVMLLNMEEVFVFNNKNKRCDLKVYPYYQGSKSLKDKFGNLNFTNYFYYDKELQDKINDELKIKLATEGIKNKKRLGLGETVIYDNPKIYIRQSAKEIIATYDGRKSSANNSLYVFSLRGDSVEIRQFLKFICGLLNSDILTFYAQKKNIIRYLNGKQPQIKISDLYTIRIPADPFLQNKISTLVDDLYKKRINKKGCLNKINNYINEYYNLSTESARFIQESIKNF